MRKGKSYKIIESQIGNLAIFWSNMRDRINIEEELGSDFEKIDSEKYIKTLIKYICHKIIREQRKTQRSYTFRIRN